METWVTPPADRAQQRSILLVEDDEISRQVEEWKLRKLGYQVQTATNGREALQILQENFCDLLLMNCHLLEMDGLGVSIAIRSSDPKTMNPDIPIIALTTQVSDADRELCQASGMNDLLRKPVNSQELAATLEYWLSISAASADIPTPEDEGSTSPAFDEAELLERLMDDRQLEKLILEAFLNEIPAQILLFKGYIAKREIANARLQAHSMRGASANLAAHALRDAFLEAETVAKSGDLDGMDTCVVQIEREYKRFERTVKKLEWMADKGVQQR